MAVRPVIIPAPFPPATGGRSTVAGRSIIHTLRAHQYDAFFAGGFVRDALIGRETHDIDIATSAHPDQVAALFDNSRMIGKSFGVVQVIADEIAFEIATFRRDIGVADGRHPGSIAFTTAGEDAQRRDFTINGLFYDPVEHTITDYVDGLPDMEAKTVRAIGDPAHRFSEDHLRMMRAIRFASVLNFSIEPATVAAVKEHAEQLARISPERIRGEWIRTFMEAPDPGAALDLFRDTGILEVILPEVSALVGVEQPPAYHPEGDVYTHVRLMLNMMEKRSPELIWAILLHDISKPETFAIGTDRDGNEQIQFRGHAERGAVKAEAILRRFKCPNETIAAVCTAVKNHMKFISVPQMRTSTLRRWAGSKHFPLEMELHRIDCLASNGKLDHYDFVENFHEQLANEPVLPPPLLTGKDLIELGCKPGPKMGRLIKKLYDAQLQGEFSTREEAVHWLKQQDQPMGR